MSNISYRSSHTKNHDFSIRLLYVSKARYEEDWHSTMHMHPFTELFYVVNGSGLFKLQDKSFTVKTDDLVIVNAHLLHTESSKHSNPLEYIVLGIDGISLEPLQDNKRLFKENLYSIQNMRKHRNEILSYLNLLLEEAKTANEHYEIICKKLSEVLVLNLTRWIESDITLSVDSTSHKSGAYIKKYIDIHYSDDLDLDALATATYMNKYYLSHIFKKSFGISPIQYLIEKRIAVAKFQLETTKYSIGEVAALVGYNNASYFSQIFKKTTEMTPSEYRAANNLVSQG